MVIVRLLILPEVNSTYLKIVKIIAVFMQILFRKKKKIYSEEKSGLNEIRSVTYAITPTLTTEPAIGRTEADNDVSS